MSWIQEFKDSVVNLNLKKIMSVFFNHVLSSSFLLRPLLALRPSLNTKTNAGLVANSNDCLFGFIFTFISSLGRTAEQGCA